MNRRRYLPLVATGLLLPAASGFSATVEIRCPEEIQVAEQVTSTHADWSSTPDLGIRGYYLAGLSLYSGHPSELASLVPGRTIAGKRSARHIWQFQAGPAESYWIGCSYQHSRSLLIRPLPAGVTRCELTESLLPDGTRQRIESFVCSVPSPAPAAQPTSAPSR